MKNNTLNGMPATVLETMADHLSGQPEPVKIRSVEDHAALAAQALWAFACKTGLNRESESVETVVTDFLANLLHLCGQCDPDGDGAGCLNGLLVTAMMHYQQECGGNGEELI
ncbi:hypothetical protein ABR157_005407 [Enterobacter soli]|uniref:hypothetical protein n=1 Tax=unclassified Enterobacter cloacae complex TaxID=2757714 RepID=UPI001EF0D597|nr:MULTISPECIES: hypothetical protein [unclassified Enterobacter cloacae complex]UKB52241.1 hypothetical protein L3071_25255 [Enterobacter cloacae complex sp. ECL404]UKB62495.1 hypothetical protein L3069_24985 [Enterobacter cloacae complex sp. ECL411]HDR2894222.1 hypothetical protein [Enterobacter asburiae]